MEHVGAGPMTIKVVVMGPLLKDPAKVQWAFDNPQSKVVVPWQSRRQWSIRIHYLFVVWYQKFEQNKNKNKLIN
jgi:hypothetical protein